MKKNSEKNETNYKTLKRNYNNSIQKAKNEYYGKELFRSSKDSKKMWSIINTIIAKKSVPEPVRSIRYNDLVLKEDAEISEVFAEFYKHAAVDRTNDITSDEDFHSFLSEKDRRNETFQLKPVEVWDVWKIIKSMKPKSSSGPDSISGKLICKAATSLVQPLKFIINKSFEEGKFPTRLKVSKIVPLHKRGPHEVQNYRPVCQVPGFSKIIEKAVISQLNDYNNKNFQDPNQFSYRPHHKTQDAVLLARHTIEKEISQKKFVLVILIDLSVAFDSIDTETILPNKLKFYGSNEKALSFFKSYFNERKHYVEWNGTKSSTKNLFNASVVQGSCMGPTIFNNYYRDVKYVINSDMDAKADTNNGACAGGKNGKDSNEISSVEVLFADDSLAIVSGDNAEKVMESGNKILENTSKYMDSNKLILNQKKTQYLFFKPKGKQKIEVKTKLKIKNQEIMEVDSARYLGVILDNKLKFHEHFKLVKSKLMDGVKALRCTRRTLSYRAKLALYQGYFKSHAEYCSITYMDKLNKKQLQELYTLQKQAIRLVFNARKNVHTEKLFKMAEIVPITKLYESECIKLVFKNKLDPSSELQPIAIKKLLINENQESSRIYGSNNRIKIPSHYKSDHCMYQIIKKFNNANNELKECGNLWSLKRMLKEEFLQSLPKCEINNCNICMLDNRRNYEKYMLY